MSNRSPDPLDDVPNAGDDATSGKRGAANEDLDEIAVLRRKVDRLIAERVTPALGNAADRAEAFAQQTAIRVREQPLAAVAAAFLAGIAIGVLLRR